MAREIILDEIEKKSDTLNMYFRIDNNPLVLSYRFETIGCEPIDLSRIEERFDSTVISLMHFAITRGYDFRSEYPVDPELYYRLTEQLIPQMIRASEMAAHKDQLLSAWHDVKIHAPLVAPAPPTTDRWIGTGISCGVDSLTAVYEYSQLCKIPEHQLTHLICMKIGAHHGRNIFNANRENRLFRAELDKVKRFVDETKFPLVIVDSNLWEFILDAFDSRSYSRQYTFRICGTLNLLQNYLATYYIGDAYGIDHFDVDTGRSCASYDRWLVPLLSTDNLQFYLSDAKGSGRFDKTKLLCQYPPSYDNLHVCWDSEGNCGHCGKCIRTLLALDILGELDKYKNSFDLEAYHKNRTDLIRQAIETRDSNYYFGELYKHMPDEMKNLI